MLREFDRGKMSMEVKHTRNIQRYVDVCIIVGHSIITHCQEHAVQRADQIIPSYLDMEIRLYDIAQYFKICRHRQCTIKMLI